MRARLLASDSGEQIQEEPRAGVAGLSLESAPPACTKASQVLELASCNLLLLPLEAESRADWMKKHIKDVEETFVTGDDRIGSHRLVKIQLC